MKQNPFDEGAREYEAWFNKNQETFQSELRAIKAVLPPFRKAVDVGTGTGIFAKELGVSMGVEPSRAMAELARQKGIKVHLGVSENLPLESATFDLVLMITVDSFVSDLKQSFQEIHRVLEKKGHFLIGFLDRETPLGQIYEVNKDQDVNYKEATFHSSEEIQCLLKEVGFQILEKRQTVETFENIVHEIRIGHGQGVFAVLLCQKME